VKNCFVSIEPNCTMATEFIDVDSLNSLTIMNLFLSGNIQIKQTDRVIDRILRLLIERFSGFQDRECGTPPWKEVSSLTMDFFLL